VVMAKNGANIEGAPELMKEMGRMESPGDSKSAMKPFNGVKIFSATMAKGRDALGEQVTEWLSSAPNREVVDTVITQSSDEAFHCIAITIFYRDPLPSAG
jgi:hypothetical protein